MRSNYRKLNAPDFCPGLFFFKKICKKAEKNCKKVLTKASKWCIILVSKEKGQTKPDMKKGDKK